jgi:hypothetical protein
MNATNELSIAADLKPSTVQEPSALKVKDKTTSSTPTDSPYPDVLLEEEPDETGEEPEMQSQQHGQQDEQQEPSTSEDEKISAIKVKEAKTTAKDTSDVPLEDESTNDKQDEVPDEAKDIEEEPEMKPSLQMFDIDNDEEETADDQLHVSQADSRVMDSAEDTYTTIMSNLDKNIDSDIPSSYDIRDMH